MRIAEIVAGFLFALALVLYFFLLPGWNTLLVLTLGFLALLYFYFGFALFNHIRLRHIFKKSSYQGISALRIVGAVCTGMALSAMVIGLLFKFLSWPGAIINLFGGLFLLLIVAVISIVKYSQNKSVYYVRIFRRVGIFGGLGLVLVLLPGSFLTEVRLRDHPAYRAALMNSRAHPDDDSLRMKANEERRKIDEEQAK